LHHDGDVLLRANRQETFDLSASLVPLWALAFGAEGLTAFLAAASCFFVTKPAG